MDTFIYELRYMTYIDNLVKLNLIEEIMGNDIQHLTEIICNSMLICTVPSGAEMYIDGDASSLITYEYSDAVDSFITYVFNIENDCSIEFVNSGT